MIFNKNELGHKLQEISYRGNGLTNEDVQVLRTVSTYFLNDAPLLTYDEFISLFNCTITDEDKEVKRITITPVRDNIRVFMNSNFSTDQFINNELKMVINPQIQEHIQRLAYTQFVQQIKELKSKL